MVCFRFLFAVVRFDKIDNKKNSKAHQKEVQWSTSQRVIVWKYEFIQQSYQTSEQMDAHRKPSK